jgi:hypothetical protein
VFGFIHDMKLTGEFKMDKIIWQDVEVETHKQLSPGRKEDER